MTRNAISEIENNQADTLKATSTPAQLSRSVASSASTSATRDESLFEDTLLDSTTGQRNRRTWSTFLSFVLQLLLLGSVLLLPLWFVDVLPQQQLVTLLVAPAPPAPLPAASTPSQRKVVRVASDIVNGRLRTPSRIPTRVQMVKDDEDPPPGTSTGLVIGGLPGEIPGGQLDGAIGGIIGATSGPAAPAFKAAPTVQRVRVSPGVIKGLLIHRVEPVYPPLAQQARIQGAVVLTAIIDKDGNVERLQLVSGHPLLAPAAIEAVKQWRYKPFLLGGQPLEVETTVTVNFHVRSE